MARLRSVLIVFAMLAAAFMLSAVPAAAATVNPFPAGSPLVFLSQSDNSTETTLYQAVQTSGQLKFNSSGKDTTPYNAIGFNTTDMYLYGINSVTTGAPRLVRVGVGGATAAVGTVTGLANASSFAAGAFNAGDMGTGAWAGTYFFRSSANLTSLYYINNVSTSLAATTVTLSMSVPNTADIVYLDGFIWAFFGNSNTTGSGGSGFYRITPSTTTTNWQVAYFPMNLSTYGIIEDNYGAQWAYGNGNIGISTNANGAGATGNTTPVAYQIQITNPSSASPTFAVISKMPTTYSSGNDAASYVGVPIDLGISKTVSPGVYTANGPITYTLTVTNTDALYTSSGFVVTDAIPAYVTNPKSSNTGVTFSGNNMTWVGDALGPGASESITVTGTASTSASGAIVNSATVIGNEEDDNAANNTATAITVSSLYLNKHAYINGSSTASDGTAASPVVVQIGDTIKYAINVYNWQPNTAGDIVTDVVPAGLTVNTASINPSGTFDPSTNTITWDFSGAGNGVITPVFTATVTSGGEFDNTAQVTYNNGNTATTNTTYHKATSSTLTVTKTITGTFADMTRQFPFTITVKNPSGAPLTGTITSTAGALTLVAGTASFSLGNGGNIVFTIPIGDTAQITETDNGGYHTTYVDSGNPGITSTGPATTVLTIVGNRQIDFTNDAIYAPPTGISMEVRALLDMSGIVFLFGVFGYAFRLASISRKRKGVN